ncbi:MAG: helix-turn-helix domain-containing protein [Firmicutes bacterium]|nr:helix-turn-helix domain-containing protein [Bacillota bacterium]
MNQKIHGEALLVHLTVTQIKEVIESVFQQSSFFPSNQPEIIDIEEVLKLTGYKKATLYKLIHERKIPFHKPTHGGRRVFFKSAEIEQWLLSNRIETNEDFCQNYGIREKRSSTTRLKQKLYSLKLLLRLFTTFQGIVKKYETQIQELEEKVAKYETNNQIIENLFNDETN